MLDKGRATINGKSGEYHFDCPLDQSFLSFVGMEAALVKEQLELGKGDGEMLEWITANAKLKRAPFEIAAWSALAENRVPMDLESRAYFSDLLGKVAPKRADVATWFDLLDVDDFVTFGGKV
jgi:hypothetical protein